MRLTRWRRMSAANSEAVPPQPDRFMADVDPALEQQVFHIARRQRGPHLHHHHQPDHLWRRVEVAERVRSLPHAHTLAEQERAAPVALTGLSRAIAMERAAIQPASIPESIARSIMTAFI
jgi:hypothetical protein